MRRSEHAEGIRHTLLKTLVEDEMGDLNQQKLSNPFWEPPNEGYDQVVDWFGTEAVGDIILSAYGVALYHNCVQGRQRK